MEKECALCGKLFETQNKNRKYCDDCIAHKKLRQIEISCADKHMNVYNPVVTHEGICSECGKPFTKLQKFMYKFSLTANDYHPYVEFCSNKCINRYAKKHKPCEICGKLLIDAYTDKNIDTETLNCCSVACQKIYDKQLFEKRLANGYYRKCENCGKLYHGNGKFFCSRKCCAEAQKNGWTNDSKPVIEEPKFIDVRCRCRICKKQPIVKVPTEKIEYFLENVRDNYICSVCKKKNSLI